MFKGPAAPTNQVHDFHPPISPEGLYWVTPVPMSGLVISPDGRTATLHLVNVPIIDQPRWPAMDADSTPAFMDCTVVWTATDQSATYEDPMRQYRFEGHIATAQLEAKIRVPETGFTFTTDPLASSTCDFAVMGNAVNGKYYA